MTRKRSSRRRHHRHPIVPVVLLVLVVAVALGGERAIFALIELGTGLALVCWLMVMFAAVRAVHWVSRRLAPRRPAVEIPRQRRTSVSPSDPDAHWMAARRRFDTLRGEYAAYECDPLAVLRLPALADVTVPATARFVHAYAEAQALDTDRRPPPDHLRDYLAAVDSACRAWQAARDAADRIRLTGLSPAERSSVQRVIKLLTMAADTGHDGERLSAYAKARDELLRLERSGAISLPRPARFALDDHARGRLSA